MVLDLNETYDTEETQDCDADYQDLVLSLNCAETVEVKALENRVKLNEGLLTPKQVRMRAEIAARRQKPASRRARQPKASYERVAAAKLAQQHMQEISGEKEIPLRQAAIMNAHNIEMQRRKAEYLQRMRKLRRMPACNFEASVSGAALAPMAITACGQANAVEFYN
ncbi:hypothetical protein LPJ78_002386 [Coemansia sp. RSA 989]|nr:hypothetical protein LPJ78_002386 [Coemansia sp. RSA 989]